MLTIFHTDSKDLSLLQTSWSQELNPVIVNPIVNGSLLKSIALANGTTVINHKLGRMMQGWFITDISGAATVYRSQPLNAQTLTLTSNAIVTVNLWVF